MNKAAFRTRARKWWREEIRPLLVLALVMCSLRSSLADWNNVPTGSMNPTIIEGDRVFVNKVAYDLKVPFTTVRLAEWSQPKRGDIVVFFSPHDGTRLVKRVIGLPGELIEMRNEHLFINGEEVEYGPLDPAVSAQLPTPDRERSVFALERLQERSHAIMAIPAVNAMRTFGPVRVAEGSYFVMGDSRDNSFDSRYFGTVERKRIVGRASAVVMSLDRSRFWLPRTSRFLKPLDPQTQP